MSNPGQGTLGDLAPGDIGLGDEIEQLHGLTNNVLLFALSPSHVASGGGDLSVTIFGFRLVNPTTLHFGGNSIATLWINAHTLSAVIPAALLATPGTVVIFLTNSKGTSNTLFFTITGSPVNRTVVVERMTIPIIMNDIGVHQSTHAVTVNSMGLPIVMADIPTLTSRKVVVESMALPIVMADIGTHQGTHIVQVGQMTLPIVMADILTSTHNRTVVVQSMAIPIVMADIITHQTTHIVTVQSMAIPITMAPILTSKGVTLPDADFEAIPVQPGMDIFTPNVGGVATGPSILNINSEAWPNKAVNIAGNAFTANLGLRFYSQTTAGNGIFVDDTSQAFKRRLNGNLASWSIPPTILDGAAIMVWPETTGGIGKGILLNKADPQFVLSKNTGFNSAIIGDVIAVRGRNLTKPILSTTTATIGTGSKTFAITNGTFTPGQNVLILARSSAGQAGAANFMDGTVASSTSSSVTANIVTPTGSGTFSSWKIYSPGQNFIQLGVSGGQTTIVLANYADPWNVEFALPNQIGSHVLQPGDAVSIAVSNGMGGKYGWKTCPVALTVQTAASLGMNYANGGTLPASGDTTGTADSAAFIAAISACTVPTRFQLQSANYYFNQQIFLGGHFGVAISLQGAGKASTFLNAASGSNFAGTSFFQCNSNIPAELNALTVVATGNTTFSTNGVNQISRFVNADVQSKGCRVPAIAFGGGGSQFHGYMVGCTVTGTNVFAQNPLSVYVDNCARIVTDGDIGDDGEIGFWLWGSRYASITRTTCKDMTPNGPLSERGGGKFVDFFINSANGFVYRCATTKLSPLVGDPNPGSGEQIVTEGASSDGFAALVQSTATVSGVTTLTFASPGAISSPCHAWAVFGSGQGQWANVTGRSGNTFTLDRLWANIDTTTQVNMQLGASEVIAVLNTLNGNNQPNTSSNGWETFEGSAACCFQHNTVTDCVYGWSDFSEDFGAPGVFEPCFWNTIADNLASHCQYARRDAGIIFLGNLYRDNQGITTAAELELEGGPTYPRNEANISDNETFTGAPIGVYSASGIPSGQSNQTILLWNTQFIGNQTGPAFAANGYQADLQGTSSFTGFTGGGTGLNYFVATTGNDSNPGTSAQPFLTLQRAVAALMPGDTLTARAGTYAGFISGWDSTPATVGDPVGIINGNAANPITIQADPNAAAGSVIINSRASHVLAGIDFEPGCDYINVIGFTIDDTAHGITQTSNRGFGIKSAGKFGSIKNCTVKNITYGQGIFVDNATNVQITGNTVFGTLSQGNDNYGHGMYVSGSTSGAVVTGNTIHNNERLGLHVNGDVSEGAPGIVSNATIANNFIYSNGQNAINCDGIVNSLIYNNLCYDYAGYGIVLYQGDAGAPSTGNVIVNNTFYTAQGGAGAAVRIENGATGCTVLNNILFGGGGVALRVSNDSLSGLTSDYNIGVAATFFQSEDTSTISTLAAWHTAHGQDAHSVGSTAAATFVGPGSNNYKPLNPGPAIAAGTNTDAPTVDIVGLLRVSGKIDIGAYAVQILTSLTLYPQTVLVPGSAAQCFTPYPLDQVGNLMVTTPTYVFSIQSGGGSINGSGVYTAPASGSAVTKVAVGSVIATSAVTIDASFVPGITMSGGVVTIKVNGFSNSVVAQVVTLNNVPILSISASSQDSGGNPTLSAQQQYTLSTITHIYCYGQAGGTVSFSNTSPVDCTVFGGTMTNSLQGGPGNDYIQAGSAGPSFSQSCKGFAGNNIIVGGPGSNSLYGGSGTNIIVPGLGPNQIFPSG